MAMFYICAIQYSSHQPHVASVAEELNVNFIEF